MDLYEFEASLSYRASSGTARATLKDTCLENKRTNKKPSLLAFLLLSRKEPTWGLWAVFRQEEITQPGNQGSCSNVGGKEQYYQ